MIGSKTKFNIMDFLIILIVVLIIASSAVRGIAIKRFEKENKISKTTVVMSVTDIDTTGFSMIKRDDNIYCTEKFGEAPLGKIVLKKHSSTGMETENGERTGEFYEIAIEAQCLVNGDGFYSINNEFIAPGMKLIADNGAVKFNCEVISVKSAE